MDDEFRCRVGWLIEGILELAKNESNRTLMLGRMQGIYDLLSQMGEYDLAQTVAQSWPYNGEGVN